MASLSEYLFHAEPGITLYCGDCREILPLLEADVLVTDPPYGIAHASNYVAPTTTASWMNSEIAGDADVTVRDQALAAFHGDWACFGSLARAAPLGTRATLVWDKGPASGMGDLSIPWKQSFELIFIGGHGWGGSRDEGVLKRHHVVTRASMGRTHPNEKPVSLLAYLLSKHPARSVLDPFAGSGSTLLAAKNLGRQAIGIELEPRYCEIAVKRLRQEVLALA